MSAHAEIATNISLQSITFCKYQLNIAKKDILLSFPQLLDLRNRVNRLSLPSSLEDIIDTDNFVLLFIADRQHLVYLDIPQLIRLKRKVDSFFYNVNPVLI